MDDGVAGLRSRVAALSRGIEALRGPGAPPLRVERASGGLLRLACGDRVVRETADEDDLLCGVASYVELETERLLAGRIVFHAAVVTGEAGTLAAFGRSTAGKTTLAVALIELGFSYVTDDAAIVEEDGAISPHPRPLRLREGAAALLGSLGGRFERVAHVAEPGLVLDYLVPTEAATAVASCRPSAVAFLERDRAELAIEPISAAEATARMLEHTLAAAPSPETLRRARKVVEHAPARVLVRGGAPRAIAAALQGLALTGSSPGPRAGPAACST